MYVDCFSDNKSNGYRYFTRTTSMETRNKKYQRHRKTSRGKSNRRLHLVITRDYIISKLMPIVFLKFSNCEAWKTHLDFQIYKALNHRYQIGLEALNQHLPDFRIEIVYR